MINVLICGVTGKMGQEAARAVANDPRFHYVGGVSRADDLRSKIIETSAEVVVDLTTPESVFQNTKIIMETGARPVIGTTGLTEHQIKQLQSECIQLKRGGVIAPNFSIGMNLLMKYAADLARYYPNVEIIEMHHDQKKDAPSGTAIKTAERIAAGQKTQNRNVSTVKETLSIPGVRGGCVEGIPIHSIRLSGLVAHEMIIFGGRGETVTLRHDAIARESFMEGLCLACARVMEIDQLFYGLEHLL